MSEQCGLLSHNQKQFVEQWLTDKSDGDVGCPICREQEWILGEYLVAAPVFAPAGQESAKTSFPSVMVVCDGCGYSMFFNATIVGLMGNADVEIKFSDMESVPEESNVKPLRRAAA